LRAVKFSNDLNPYPMLALSAHYQQLKGDIMPTIEYVLEKPSFINGSEVARMFYYPLPIHKQKAFRAEQSKYRNYNIHI